MRAPLFIVVLAAVGCGKSDREPRGLAGPIPTAKGEAPVKEGSGKPGTQIGKLPIEVKPEQPAPMIDSKVKAFRDGMAKFIEEARSLTRAMELGPRLETYRGRVEKLQEAYSRVPEPPESHREVHKAAKSITERFEDGIDHLRIAASPNKALSMEGARGFLELTGKLRRWLDDLETAAAK